MNYILLLCSLLFPIKSNSGSVDTDKTAKLVFKIEQNREVYEASMFGEPPQLAIWLENTSNHQIRTVYVTQRTGTGDFEGKMEIAVALPAWVTAFRQETGRTGFPTPSNPVTDAISGATSKLEIIQKEAIVTANQNWNYYIEVNVSGDFNKGFPNYQSNGEIDDQANGQPSLVYKGSISSIPGKVSKPILYGRSEQKMFSPSMNPDLAEITTASTLLRSIEVSCQKMN